jgi:adenylate cyclase
MVGSTQRVERRLAAIFAADVAGYSRLMNQDEVGTLRTLTAHRKIMDGLIAEHGGRVANTAGDSVLAEFPSVVDAVQCAISVQEKLRLANAGLADERRLQFRIGVHVGDVMVKGGDLLGDSINIAARLEALADPGGICISGDAHSHVRKAVPLTFIDLGQQQVKNIDEPIRAYTLTGSAPPFRFAAVEVAPKPLPLPEKPSIAVLPFANMSGDPEQEYFADGVVEDIITALSRARWFFVIARNSSFVYKNKAVDVRQIGRELGVRYVLEGGIRKAGNTVRITGQLIEAETGRHIWADKFDGELAAIFELQDRVAEGVVGAIEPSLHDAEIERAKAKSTESLGAYDCYLLALAHSYSGTKDNFNKAQELLLKAIALDSQYAQAKAAAARIVMLKVVQTWATEQDVALGIKLAHEALADSRDDPTVLRSAGHALAFLAHEFDLAVSVLRRAVALNPNSAQVFASNGIVHNYYGDTATAIDHLNRAIRLSPLDPEMSYFLCGLGMSYSIRGEYDRSLTYARDALHLKPSYALGHRISIVALAHLGRFEEARSSAVQLLRMSPTFSSRSFALPFRDPRVIEKWRDAFHLAGLPE